MPGGAGCQVGMQANIGRRPGTRVRATRAVVFQLPQILSGSYIFFGHSNILKAFALVAWRQGCRNDSQVCPTSAPPSRSLEAGEYPGLLVTL